MNINVDPLRYQGVSYLAESCVVLMGYSPSHFCQQVFAFLRLSEEVGVYVFCRVPIVCREAVVGFERDVSVEGDYGFVCGEGWWWKGTRQGQCSLVWPSG